MKLFINIILVLIVLAGLGGMIYLSIDGDRFLGAAGLAMLYFIGSIGYFVNCYTKLVNLASFFSYKGYYIYKY